MDRKVGQNKTEWSKTHFTSVNGDAVVSSPSSSFGKKKTKTDKKICFYFYVESKILAEKTNSCVPVDARCALRNVA